MKKSNMRDSRRSLRSILFPALIILLLILFVSCQELFTYSLLEGLQRDPSDLPAEQQISYAQSALASGDTAAMADIYDEIVALAVDDPDLYLLAADLAMGASGITGAVDDVLSADDPSTLDFNAVLASVDLVMLANVADNVLAAELNSVAGISDQQYLAAAGAEILQFVENSTNDISTVDWTNATTAAASGPEIENAYNFLISAGEDPATFDDLFGG